MNISHWKCACLALGIALSLYGRTNAQERREVGNLVLEGIPEIPEEVRSRLQQYQNTRSASFADWMPGNEGILISTRFGNTYQLHTVARPGGARDQITFFDEPVSGGSFCPLEENNGFLFTKDVGGNEFAQIYWYDMDTRKSEMLSDGESVNMGIVWSNKGDRFAFTSTRRNKKDFDVYVSSIASPKEANLKIDRGSGYWIVTDWSPDDSKLLVLQYISSTKSNSYILDLGTGELNQINESGKESVFVAIQWDRTGENVYVVSDEGKEFSTLGILHLATGELEYITEGIPWDVEDFTANQDRTKAAFTVNENGFSRLYLMNLETGTFHPVQDLPVGQIGGLKFHPGKDEIAMVINTAHGPSDVYTMDYQNMETMRWTRSEVGGLNTGTFPEPTLITYKTFDQVNGEPRMIPAFVYKPAKGEGPFPVIINIHGGPEGQYTPSFSSIRAYLVNELGVAMIAPNVRGSSGYGKSYLKLDNGFKREESVRDIGQLIEWIKKQPGLDAGRIAVIGGSYGGYMVLASMVQYNDLLKCGVDLVGISNFVTFLENTEEYRRDQRRVEYGDERDPEMRKYLSSISPANHAESITKPLFVIQGANDPRVPSTESEQMVQSIRENGGVVWYMLAKDEGHGFRKKENNDRMSEAMILFLMENLLK